MTEQEAMQKLCPMMLSSTPGEPRWCVGSVCMAFVVRRVPEIIPKDGVCRLVDDCHCGLVHQVWK